MRPLIPLALVALLSACLPFGGQDGAGPPKGSPLASSAIEVTSLDAPAAVPAAGPAATPRGPASGSEPPAATPPQARPAAASSDRPAAPSAAPSAEDAAETGPAPTEAPPPPPPKSPAQIACENDGGTWARAGGSVAMTCFRPTRDGGKSCRRESDCSTLCLARSRTCAPVSPLFGCHEILQDDGRAVTLCLD